MTTESPLPLPPPAPKTVTLTITDAEEAGKCSLRYHIEPSSAPP